MRPYTAADFGHSPLVVFYEITRACDLKCQHCRANSLRHCEPDELTPAQSRALVEQLLEFPRPPMLVLTGGDPMKRADLFDLITHAVTAGLQVALTPSATPLVTREAIVRLQHSGLHRLAVSLDGATAATHDRFRRVPDSFDRTFQIISDARACDLPVQINTTIARHNVDEVDAMANLIAGEGIVLWSVFFLVPTGRAQANQRISPAEYEVVFEKLRQHARRQPYGIKTTEAPHYRRFLARHYMMAGEDRRVNRRSDIVGTNDGRGVLFVGRTGEIYPSGFLPISCGRFSRDSVVHAYQESPLFRALRDPARLGGKCGACEYREECGGSRARAYALTGDPLAAEPDCQYLPANFRIARAMS